jgi:DNA-binding transcriptional MocR family regulator
MTERSSIAAVAASLRSVVAQSRPGDRLPSSRTLVKRMGVSPVTVSRALGVLAAEGAVHVRPGAGAFVAPAQPAAIARDRDWGWQSVALGNHTVDDSGIRSLMQEVVPGTISLASGYPHPSLTPARHLAAAMARAARRPGVWERPQLNGLGALRRWFAESIGPSISPDDVLVTSGGQSALSVAMRATARPGSPVLVESPTYPGALAVTRAAGLTAVPVPVDEGGIRCDMLEEAFGRTGARVLYCQPTFHNPTGCVMDPGRRAEVMAIVAAAGAFLIEDDWARWLAQDARPPAPMITDDADGRVIHLTSLTKSAAPGLRIGALVARGPVAERLRALRLVDAMFVSGPLQETALDLVSSTTWSRHLAALNGALRARKRALLEALAEHLPEVRLSCAPGGGFYVWGRLPAGLDDIEVAATAVPAGVVVGAGRPFFAAEPPGAFLRFSFAGPAHLADVEEGVRRLAGVMHGA